MSEETEAKKAGSPVLGERFMAEKAVAGEAAFSAAGAVNKTGFLLLFTIAAACFSWTIAESLMSSIWGIAILGMILGMVIAFVPALAPAMAPFYAIVEGVFLGVVSAVFESRYPGIVFQASVGTMGILMVMVIGYSSGILKLGQRGKAVVMACTLGIGILYLVAMAGRFFNYEIGFLHDSSWLGIGFNVAVLIIAALNFSLDFEFIETAQQEGLAKRMEWYAAFGVLVTLIWVYLEVLRLLSKLRSR